MGQMTDAQVGVSVSLPLEFEHIKLIYSLIDLPNIQIYISGLSEYPDEILDYAYDNIEEIDTDMLDELSIQPTREEFNMKYAELNIKKDLIFHFIYVCATIYARNLSFRSTSRLFSNDEHLSTPMELINDILKGVELFKNSYVSEEYIKIGNTIYDG